MFHYSLVSVLDGINPELLQYSLILLIDGHLHFFLHLVKNLRPLPAEWKIANIHPIILVHIPQIGLVLQNL